MTAPTIRIHRDGTITADGEAIGAVVRYPRRDWTALRHGQYVATRSTRRAAINALLDHTYGTDRWT